MPGKPVVIQLNPDEITYSKGRQELEAVNLLKKRKGIIKVRTCANGSKKNRYLKEGESVTSPTVPLEGLFTTLKFSAYEGREVATFYVPGDYLHVDMLHDIVFIEIKGNICGYNVSDLPRSQAEHEV